MVISTCTHDEKKRWGKDRQGRQRYKCCLCGKRFIDEQPKPLGDMRIDLDTAKLALRLLTEGMSIRATERTTGLHRDTVMKLMVHFGIACQQFMDARMRKLKLTHLQFDEQWTFVAKKQSRLTIDERAESATQGDMYLWTCSATWKPSARRSPKATPTATRPSMATTSPSGKASSARQPRRARPFRNPAPPFWRLSAWQAPPRGAGEASHRPRTFSP